MKVHCLAPFLALAVPSIASAAWEVKEKKDPFTDKVTYIVSADSRPGDGKMTIAVICKDELRLGFVTDSFLSGPTVNAEYRFDSEAPDKILLLNKGNTPWTLGHALPPLIAEISNHKTMAVRISDYHGESTQAVFGLTGAAVLVREALRRCPNNR